MKIIAVNSALNSKQKSSNKTTKQQQTNDMCSFSKVNNRISLYDKGIYKYQKTFSFKGTPWAVPSASIYDAGDAIKTYQYLASGNYLDMHDDAFAPENQKIRANNLKFLDKLSSDSDKKRFVDYYCSLTSFPNLAKVATNIENTFLNAAVASSNNMKNTTQYPSSYFDIIKVGYDDTCSVGKQKAYPGSDIDKGYVIIKGSDKDEVNEQLVNEFKGQLWQNTDQRILSYNHGVSSVPIVYTLKQIIDMSKAIEKNMVQKNVNTAIANKTFETYDPEYKTSAYYNKIVSTSFPKGHYNNIKYLTPSSPTKNDIKNFAFFIEILREGKTLKATSNNEYLSQMDYVKNTDFYKYSNLCQTRYVKTESQPKRIETIKHGFFKDKIEVTIQEPNIKEKTKLTKRKEMADKFYDMTVSDKYKFVKSIIYSSCDDKIDNAVLFENNFDMSDKLEPVFNYMVTGDEKLLYIPDLKNSEGEWNLKYGKSNNQKVTLYLGNYGEDKATLWVDTSDPVAIEQTINNIDLVKRIDKFKDINKLQAPCYTSERTSTDTQKKSYYGSKIYEYQI